MNKQSKIVACVVIGFIIVMFTILLYSNNNESIYMDINSLIVEAISDDYTILENFAVGEKQFYCILDNSLERPSFFLLSTMDVGQNIVIDKLSVRTGMSSGGENLNLGFTIDTYTIECVISKSVDKYICEYTIHP